MGTQLGNVTQIYGHKHNTTVTNLNGETIMSSAYLNKNTIIISSPQSINKEDIGTYSLFVTDSEGQPVRLSYTIQPGNGLVIGRNGEPAVSGDGLDVISMAIDNHSIMADDPEYPEAIYVKKENIIDNDTLMVVTPSDKPSCIKVITENLDHAGNTASGFGIAQGDGVTITTADGYLTVQTRNLDYADDETDTHGIIDANTNPYRTVRSDNGILSVWTQNLDRANEDSVGVVKPDGTYTFTDEDGTLTVSNFVYTYSYLGEREKLDENNNGTGEFETYRYNEHGIVVPDLVTLGTYQAGEMHVITDGLDKASNSQFGVVKLDGISMGVTSDGLLEVKQYDKLQAIMDVFDARYTYILDKLNELEGRIVVLETTSSVENIELDIDNSILTVLSQPVWDAESKTVVSPLENVSVELRVATNCKFKVSVEYEDNVNPAIVLTQVKLGSDIVVTAAGLQDYEFDSTDDTISQLKLTFECSNYRANTNESKISTVATIKITSMNDASVYKKAVHTFVRYNTKRFEVKDPIVPLIIPYPDAAYNRAVPTYITHMLFNEEVPTPLTPYDPTVVPEYSSSVPRYATSNTLVKFNIDGPYYSVMKTPHTTYENWTDSKDVLPTLTKTGNPGFLDVQIATYTRNTIDGELILDNPQEKWLGCKVETTYNVCTGIDTEHNRPYSYNTLRLFSNKGLSYTKPYRSAKVTFKYYTNALHTTTASRSIIYNENIEDKRPTLKVTATLYNGTRKGADHDYNSYLYIEALKSNGALMQSENDWSTTVYMKYIKSNGDYVTPISEAPYDVEYTLTGPVTADTLSEDVLTKKPQITSDTVGCKIVDVQTESFQYNKEGEVGPKVSFVTRNVWAKIPITSKYTFGNATITKMKVTKWDDLEMKIQFDIVPGTTTFIPEGADIKELFSVKTDKDILSRTFKFYRGSSSYDWTKYYKYCTFSASTWGTFGTTVTFRFTNEVATQPVPSTYLGKPINNYALLDTAYNKYVTINKTLNHLYSTDIYQVSTNNKNRSIPALDYFDYIRFWFALSATDVHGITTTTNFEVSSTGLSDKVGSGNKYFKYNVSIETSLSIINGYYKLAISTTHISQIGNVLANTTEFAKTVADLKTSIDELKVVESAAVLTGVSKNLNTTNLAQGVTLVSNLTTNTSKTTLTTKTGTTKTSTNIVKSLK
jgi:hypothetical protein